MSTTGDEAIAFSPLHRGHNGVIHLKSSIQSTPEPIHPTEPQPHEKFYLEDGNCVIQVENSLFCLHRSVLKHSPFFSSLFDHPPTPDVLHGLWEPDHLRLRTSNDTTPTSSTSALRRLSSEEFSDMLGVLYPSVFDGPDQTIDQWVRILKASTMLEFDRIRKMAIAKLAASNISPLEKLRYAVVHHIPLWIVESLVELSLRPARLPVEVAVLLGEASFVRLTGAREAVRDHLYDVLRTKTWKCFGQTLKYCKPCNEQMSSALKLALSAPSFRGTLAQYLKELTTTPVYDRDGDQTRGLCPYCISVFDSELVRWLSIDKVEAIVRAEI